MKRYYYFVISLITILLVTIGLSLLNNNEGLQRNTNFDPKNPLERNLWRMQRKGGNLTYEKYQKALKRVRKNYKSQISTQSSVRDGGLNGWSFLGPNNVGGRLRAIAQNPNNQQELFIGASAGGVWRTTNGGNTWVSVSDFLPSMVISQLKFDPVDSDIIYAVTGDGLIAASALPGDGILKSMDGGDTWQKLPNSNFTTHPEINDIVIDPQNTNRIFAVASKSYSNGGVYLSEDAGDSWNYIKYLNGGAIDIKMDPNDNSRVLIGCYTKLYISNNATSSFPTFTEITGGSNQIPDDQSFPAGRIEIDISTSNPGVIYVLIDRNNGEVWRSNDSGVTWNLAGSNSNIFGNNNQGWLDNVIWVDPTNSSTIILGGVDLFRSTNSGSSITQISKWQNDIDGPSDTPNSVHADQHVIFSSVGFNGTTNKTVYIGNDGGIYRTDDIYAADTTGGWISLNQGLNITQQYGGAISDDGDFIIGGSQDNSFYYTNDGSTDWGVSYTGDGAYAAIHQDTQDIGYANTNGNQIFKTTDAGNTWTWIATFSDTSCNIASGCNNSTIFWVDDSAPLISFFRLDRNNSDILYAGAERLWRNNSSGVPNGWNSIKGTISPGTNSNPNAKITTMNSTISKNSFYVGYNTGILNKGTLSGGAYAWSNNISPQTGSPTFVTDIELNPTNDNQLIVSFGGYSTDNLWLCENINDPVSSINWTNIDLGVELQINAVTWHPSNSNWIYAATDLGIFASEDKGQTWAVTPLFDNYGDGPIFSEISELFWRGKRLCAATFSRGMWESNLIKDKIYVDKDHTCWFGICTGSFFNPYNDFKDALNAAGHGSEIIFKSEGTHDDIDMDLVIKKRIKVILNSGPVILK